MNFHDIFNIFSIWHNKNNIMPHDIKNNLKTEFMK